MKDYFEHIEDYLEGNLSNDDKMAFEDAMNNDIQLKNAVSNYYDAKNISEGLLEIDILDKISELEAQEHSSPKPTSYKKWYLIFFLFIGLAFIAFWYQNKLDQSQHKAKQEWYARNYEKPIDNNATKSVDTSDMSSFELAKYYFFLNRFEDSKLILEEMQKNAIDKDSIENIKFWLQHVYINLEEWDKVDDK